MEAPRSRSSHCEDGGDVDGGAGGAAVGSANGEYVAAAAAVVAVGAAVVGDCRGSVDCRDRELLQKDLFELQGQEAMGQAFQTEGQGVTMQAAAAFAGVARASRFRLPE